MDGLPELLQVLGGQAGGVEDDVLLDDELPLDLFERGVELEDAMWSWKVGLERLDVPLDPLAVEEVGARVCSALDRLWQLATGLQAHGDDCLGGGLLRDRPSQRRIRCEAAQAQSQAGQPADQDEATGAARGACQRSRSVVSVLVRFA
jgi:hypothetical protein